MMKKAIVLAGTRGIGRAIAENIRDLVDECVVTGKKDLDTSQLSQVRDFADKHPATDILVLNTGGPMAKPFYEITEDNWTEAYHQLFLSFVLLLQNIKVRPGGYVFLISSFNLKEPDPKLILSNSFRIAFTSVMKTLSQLHMKDRISFINIAPGPTETDRLTDLLKKDGKSIAQFAEGLPSGRVTDPKEIGLFVRSLIVNKLHGLNGVTINYDMGLSKYVL